jgi:hypothetical protein
LDLNDQNVKDYSMNVLNYLDNIYINLLIEWLEHKLINPLPTNDYDH